MMSLVALAWLAASMAASQAERSADVAALEEAKLRTWPALYRANDADGLAQFLADGFVQFSDDGSIETKEQAVTWLRANKWANANNDFRYEITRIAFYGPDTANVFGVGSFNGKAADGSACRMRYTSSNIFIRQAPGWKPIFSHTTAAACASEEKG
jgi:ketosteroid isomerase-like protein